MALERPDAFLAASARAGFGALAGTVAFAASAAALSDRSAALALGAGLTAWALAVAAALGAEAALPGGAGGALAFGAAWLTLAPRRAADRPAPSRRWRPWAEAARAGAAGLVVAAVTLAAGRLGPALSGALLALPVGMIFVAASLFARGDAAVTRVVMGDAARGALALAAFMVVAALAAGPLGGIWAVGLACAASCAVAAALGGAAARSGG
jgi:hypothetical protein